MSNTDNMQVIGLNAPLRMWILFSPAELGTSEVKITLHHNKLFRLYRWWETDEGSGFQRLEYMLDRDTGLVHLKQQEGGTGCDGKIYNTRVSVASVNDVIAANTDWVAVHKVFKVVNEEVYDQYARAAGY